MTVDEAIEWIRNFAGTAFMAPAPPRSIEAFAVLCEKALGYAALETMPHGWELMHGAADITRDWICNSKYFGKTPLEAYTKALEEES